MVSNNLDKSRVTWVMMGQLAVGSDGSWVTKCESLSAVLPGNVISKWINWGDRPRLTIPDDTRIRQSVTIIMYKYYKIIFLNNCNPIIGIRPSHKLVTTIKASKCEHQKGGVYRLMRWSWVAR